MCTTLSWCNLLYNYSCILKSSLTMIWYCCLVSTLAFFQNTNNLCVVVVFALSRIVLLLSLCNRRNRLSICLLEGSLITTNNFSWGASSQPHTSSACDSCDKQIQCMTLWAYILLLHRFFEHAWLTSFNVTHLLFDSWPIHFNSLVCIC